MTNPLRWNAYLARVDGQLAVVDSPPVCEKCGGSGGINVPLDDGHMRNPCHACAGTGKAWSWRIVPTAGMLYADGEHWYIMRPDLIHTIAAWEPYCQPGASDAAFPPLLPPASLPGCTALELLGLITGWPRDAEGLLIEHPATDTTDYYTFVARDLTATFRAQFYGTDTSPLELAIQHHKALCAWEAAR